MSYKKFSKFDGADFKVISFKNCVVFLLLKNNDAFNEQMSITFCNRI